VKTVPELKLLSRPGVRFLFPHAPIRPVTINGGAAMRAWFDIDSLNFEARNQDNEGIAASVAMIDELIAAEIDRGINESNILLAGFSQGGAIALQAGLSLPRKIAGVIALSTYLPMTEASLETIDSDKFKMPIFMAHGAIDEVIRVEYAEQSRDKLTARNANIEWHKYDIAHSVSNVFVVQTPVWYVRVNRCRALCTASLTCAGAVPPT